MGDVNRDNRPLSPHLSVYRIVWRPQMTSFSSIMNRITGNALILGAFLVVWWLLAASTSEEYFAFVDGVITSFIGDVVMFFSLLALWYHLLGGVRHLIWDSGRALDVETSEMMGWGMIGGSIVLTIVTAIIV